MSILQKNKNKLWLLIVALLCVVSLQAAPIYLNQVAGFDTISPVLAGDPEFDDTGG